MILRGADGHELGDLNTDNLVFTKIADKKSREEHDPEGWAVEVGVIDTLFLLNCQEVHIVDQEAQKIFWITLDNLTKNGILIESDYGQKILVADEYWEVKKMEK